MPGATGTITLATELTVAWLANPNMRVSSDDASAFLASVHEAFGKLSGATAEMASEQSAEEYLPA